MRPEGIWATAVTIGLIALAIQPGSNASRAATGRRDRGAAPITLTVKGDPYSTEELARRDAVEKARAEVVALLKRQTPPVAWEPSAEYVEQKLVSSTSAAPFRPDVTPVFDERMYVGTAHVELTPAVQREILHQDQAVRSRDRLWLAGKVGLAAAVVLAAVAGAVRADIRTRGYLSWWLKLGVGVVVAVAAAAAWLV